MADKSKIEWTDATWNPVRGCSRVSEGCRNCYAETVANRFCGPGSPYEGVVQVDADGKGLGKWNGQIKFVERRLLDPLHWKEPRRIFVNSMSDLFHENVTDEMLDRIFAVMALCPQHTFQILTKRPERMLEYCSISNRRAAITDAAEYLGLKAKYVDGHLQADSDGMAHWPLANVWLGVSVENQKAADERIPLLLQTRASVRFLSVEPMLNAVNLDDFLYSRPGIDSGRLNRLHWVICGGESGPGARPMHPDWARSLRDQCVGAGVPFFFKQWGEWGPGSVLMSTGERVFREFADKQQWINNGDTWVNGGVCMDSSGFELKRGSDFDVCKYPVTVIHRVGKKAAGDLLDGEQWHQFPAVGVTA